jgi:hypothetical protein
MSSKKDICSVCAYRGTCQKKFSLPAGRRCPEFERDLMIKEEPEEEAQAEQAKK